MIYIRPIKIIDNLNQYMECVEDLNNPNISICNYEQMKRCLLGRPNNIITYVITIDNNIVATATVIFERKIRYNNLCAHIEDVGVHKDHRGKGYGKMIIDHCLTIAKSKGCYKAKLFCSDKLIDFYSRIGFKKSLNGMEINL
jgi:GNAT superfamily N-acetyltransferase